MGYFPQSNSHYIENTGDEDLVLLEVLQAEAFTGEFFILQLFTGGVWVMLTVVDISLGQWIGSTPRQIVADTLNLSEDTLDKLKSEKQYVVSGNVPSE